MAYYKCGSVYTTQNSNVGINSASGDIASFQTNLAMALQKLKIAFSASQDLHGYSKPWIGGAGSNKWDEVIELGSLNTSTGDKVSSTTTSRSKNKIYLPPNTKFAFVKPSGYQMFILFYDANDTCLQYVKGTGDTSAYNSAAQFSSSTTSRTFTTPENTSYALIRMDNMTKYENNISLNYPSTVTTYSPYENICPITGFSQANVVRCGKNFLDGNKVAEDESSWYEVNANGSITVKQSDGRAWSALPEMPIKRGTYTLSRAILDGRCTMRLKTDNYSSDKLAVFNTQYSNSITIPEDTYFKIKLGNGATYPYTDNFMLEKNNATTAFTPYHGNTYLIQFGDTYYGCEIDVVHGKLKVLVGIEKFNNLNWTYQSTGTRFYTPDLASVIKHTENYSDMINLVCEVFLNATLSDVFNNANNNLIGVAPSGNVFFRCNEYNDVNALMAVIGNNYIVYELATPIEVDIDSAIITTLTGEVNQVYCDIPTSTVDLEYKVINL